MENNIETNNDKKIVSERDIQERVERLLKKQTHLKEVHPELYYRRLDDFDPVAIGKRIRQVREELRMSVTLFSSLCSITGGGLRKLEKGVIFPSSRTIYILHETFGVDIQWLLFGCHSTENSILTALYASSDEVLFDVFCRLYSYFQTGDRISFSSCTNLPHLSHFAKLEQDVYRPLKDGEQPDDEVVFEGWNLIAQMQEELNKQEETET